MDRTQLRQMRAQNYYPIRDMWLSLEAHRGSHLRSKDLESFKMKVKISELRLLDGVPDDSEAQFFTPFPRDEFDANLKATGATINWEQYGDSSDYCAALEILMLFGECLPISLKDLGCHIPWKRRSLGYSPFEHLYCVDRDEEDWQVHGVFDTYNYSVPHLVCSLVQRGPLIDNQLLRSELVCATSVMACRLQNGRYAAHRYVPVLIYSFAAQKVRVIEAHYRHPELIIRKSEILDFEKRDDENIKLMLRWMMLKPLGKTTHDLLPQESLTVPLPQRKPVPS